MALVEEVEEVGETVKRICLKGWWSFLVNSGTMEKKDLVLLARVKGKTPSVP